MVVRDILSKGGKEPMLDGDEKPTGGEKDGVAAIQKAYYEGERLRAFKHGAGIEPPISAWLRRRCPNRPYSTTAEPLRGVNRDPAVCRPARPLAPRAPR